MHSDDRVTATAWLLHLRALISELVADHAVNTWADSGLWPWDTKGLNHTAAISAALRVSVAYIKRQPACLAHGHTRVWPFQLAVAVWSHH